MSRVTARRFVVVHGHFYQPPRENPWTDMIERQLNAAPAHDWNERVTDECYEPNAFARVLDSVGAVRAIRNNYARMSFNIGPTLLAWMERKRPRLYAAIIEADVNGAAMAQVYNHMILPLANRQDQITQVRWGVRDFERRFLRSPRGMWLAETAVDTESLEALAEAGIEYTVLAPHQCARVRAPKEDWRDTPDQSVDTRRAYRTQLPSGRSIALFFYDGPTSRAVAFERVLDDGIGFANRLMSGFDAKRAEPQLRHIATDGETYGHHHVYGEMGLAAALNEIEESPDVELTNYASFLDAAPPTWECEIVERSSWSCAHGVERWRADCGCKTKAEWHQRWRAPLRVALDELRDALTPLYDGAMAELGADPSAARNAYIDVVLERSEAAQSAFLERVAPSLNERGSGSCERRLLQLMELQRNAMLMFTSCGWFFDDPSGLETAQVLQYAACALELSGSLFDAQLAEPFWERLREAPTNDPERANITDMCRESVEAGRDRRDDVLLRYAVLSAIAPDEVPPLNGVSDGVSDGAFDGVSDGAFDGAFAVDVIELERLERGEGRLAMGRLRSRSRFTGATVDVSFAALVYERPSALIAGLRPYARAEDGAEERVNEIRRAFEAGEPAAAEHAMEAWFARDERVCFDDLSRDLQLESLSRAARQWAARLEAEMAASYDASAAGLRRLMQLGGSVPPAIRGTVVAAIESRLATELARGHALDEARVRELLSEVEHHGLELDRARLGRALEAGLLRALDSLLLRPAEPELVETIGVYVTLMSDTVGTVRLRKVQNRLWRLMNLSDLRPDVRDALAGLRPKLGFAGLENNA